MEFTSERGFDLESATVVEERCRAKARRAVRLAMKLLDRDFEF